MKVAELLKSGKGTPVTPETFAVWMENKRKKRELEAKKAVETELRKKKGGKGLSVLTGRDLYNFKKDLFQVDGLTGEEGENGHEEGVEESKEEELEAAADEVAAKVQSELFLCEEDDDLDDLDDD